MPAIVTLVAPALPGATSLTLAPQPSQAGKLTVQPVTSKPYDRPTAIKPKKEVSAVLPAADSILHREPPSFPIKPSERSAYRRPDGSKVTAFQWRLYDLLITVPSGRVSTYGQFATLLSSARAVGSALRNNPFAPTVPCHRIVTSTHYIGGFNGEFKAEGKKGAKGAFEPGVFVTEKIELLRREGVDFDGKGYLKDKGCLWDGKAAEKEA
ncbi:hypothetical protein JCM8097_001796 [Rhodosporidiobolus ruineniae]